MEGEADKPVEGKTDKPAEGKAKEEGIQVEPAVQAIDKIDEANKAADRLRRENDRYEQLVIRQEKLRVTEILGGRSELTEKKTKEQDEKESARKLLPDGMSCPGVTD